MNNYEWPVVFRQIYERAVAQYTAGNTEPASYFAATESLFLAGIGCTAQEVYDFAEDWCKHQEPAFETALLITAARRDYFLVVQHGKPTGHTGRMEDLPAKTAALAGFEWLPRVIEKARLKLRGEMPADLMYGCGGDRAFFQRVKLHPADFLRLVWAAGDADQKIIDYVKHAAAA